MVARRKIPLEELEVLVQTLPTHQAIADHLTRKYGVPVSRPAVTMAIGKARIAHSSRPRYLRFLPWHVRTEHNNLYAARMLRAYARRHDGKTLPPKDEKALNTWLDHQDENRVKVGYEPARGFIDVPAGADDYDFDGPIAVRRRGLAPAFSDTSTASLKI